MKPNPDSIKDLTAEVVAFRDARDWQQFHTLKNLASALSVEASELLDLFLWSEQPRDHGNMADEVGDILYLLLLFCHEAGIDAGKALLDKNVKSNQKYPAEKARGSDKKYTAYEDKQ